MLNGIENGDINLQAQLLGLSILKIRDLINPKSYNGALSTCVRKKIPHHQTTPNDGIQEVDGSGRISNLVFHPAKSVVKAVYILTHPP